LPGGGASLRLKIVAKNAGKERFFGGKIVVEAKTHLVTMLGAANTHTHTNTRRSSGLKGGGRGTELAVERIMRPERNAQRAITETMRYERQVEESFPPWPA